MGNCCSTANEDGSHPNANHPDRATPTDDHMENEFSDSLCVHMHQSQHRSEWAVAHDAINPPPEDESPSSSCRGTTPGTMDAPVGVVLHTTARERNTVSVTIQCSTNNPFVAPKEHASLPTHTTPTGFDEAPTPDPDLTVSFEPNEGAGTWSPHSQSCALVRLVGSQPKTSSDGSVFSLDSLDSQYCDKVTEFLQSIPILPPRQRMVAWLRQLPEEPWAASPLNHNEAFDSVDQPPENQFEINF